MQSEHDNAATSTLQRKYKTNGWNIASSTHAMSQASARHPSKTPEDWQAFHRNVVHGLIKAPTKHTGANLIYSTSHDHGVVAHVDHRKKEINIITVLPKGKSHTTHEGDAKTIVESLLSFREFISN